MIAVPAVDLREGRCVQLVGGRPEEERVSLPDPLEAARSWREIGFEALHVVDLDAALGLGGNRDLVRQLCALSETAVQVGGGLRDEDAVAEVLGEGAERAIVGTRALADRPWLEKVASRFPGRIMVAADIRGSEILTRGWQEGTGLRLDSFVAQLVGLPLGGILCTDVGREGRMEGIDRESAASAVIQSPAPLWISGGISTMDDLQALDELGAAGAVLGMALYTGTLDAGQVATRFGRLRRDA